MISCSSHVIKSALAVSAIFMMPGTETVKTAAIIPGKTLRYVSFFSIPASRLSVSCFRSPVNSTAFQTIAPIPRTASQRLKNVR